MCLNRILVGDDEVCASDEGERRVILNANDERAAHIRSVLRTEAGKTVRLAVEDEGLCEATLQPNNDAGVVLRLGELSTGGTPPGVTLVLALPRPRALRRAVRAASQLGVCRILLVGAARVEKSFFAAKLVRPEALRAAAVEGVMQAAVDAHVPAVDVQPQLHRVPQSLPTSGARVLLHPGGEPLARVLQESCSSEITLAVGPEGGWLDDELAFLERCGFVRAGLGPRILATEVALAVAMTVVHEHIARVGTDNVVDSALLAS